MRLARTNSENPDFRQLVADLDVYLAEVDGDEHAYYAQFNGLDKVPYAVVAYDGDIAVGCGAFKPYEGLAEIKRMFTLPEHRGKRVAALVLAELEAWASELGYAECILETGHRQEAAISLYQRAGYQVIPNYGQYAEMANSVCMKKAISSKERAAV